jgi:lipopolysaccharide transport system ATP-binding protein
MSSEPLAISVQSLSKRYTLGRRWRGVSSLGELIAERLRRPLRRSPEETFWALRDVSLEVGQGRVVGVIGRNGAGKTTLFKVLSRITEPTEGEIRLYGRVGSLLEVGTGFHSELTGQENIYLSGSLLGMRRREIDRSFDEIVAFSGVEPFLGTPVKHYSSGMYVRLAFAVAAHLSAEILLVDEVLAVGDAEFQAKCLGKMKDVASSGRTVLFVSHNETAIRQLCNSAVLLRQGRIVFTGPTDDAFREYRAQWAEAPAGFSDAHRTRSSAAMRILDAYLSVDGIRTNEVPSGHQPVLTCDVELAWNVRFATEVLVRDQNGVAVMYAPGDLGRGVYDGLPPGRYRLSYELRLPRLAAGRYSIDLALGEPNARCFEYLEGALTIEVSQPIARSTGWRFHQKRSQGCVLIDAVPLVDRPVPAADEKAEAIGCAEPHA